MRKILVLAGILLAVTLGARAQNNAAAPAISLKDVKGRTVRLSDFRGKVVLLNFWATWCVPCAAEIPQLVRWQERYGNSGLQIIGITYPPTNVTKVRSFLAKKKVDYPVLFGSKATRRLFEGGKTLPITVIIDRSGIVRGRIDGVVFDDEFQEKVLPLLGGVRP